MNDVSQEQMHRWIKVIKRCAECSICAGSLEARGGFDDLICDDIERAIRALIESSGQPAPPAPISKEAQSLMDTTAGGRATADLVSCQPTPSPGSSMSVEEALEIVNTITSDVQACGHGWPSISATSIRAALAVLREATKPKKTPKVWVEKWAAQEEPKP